MHFDRKKKMSKQQYVKARLLHYSGIFANNNDYVFMSQQYVERGALEGRINIAMQKGIMRNSSDGTKTMELNDAFNVFQKIRGTPKYWQSKRNDLLAMINCLGPFHFFLTLSCAELRWSEIIATILMKKGFKVEVHKQYITKDEEVMTITGSDGIPVSLDEYLLKTGQSLQSIIQKETFMVTRMFDQRVKSFIKYKLMDQGEMGLKLKHYSYRVEFQARGMPHIHLVGWLHDDVIKPHLKGNSFEYKTDDNDNDKVQNLIDKHITCHLPEDEEMCKIVKDLQSHKHSKSCHKRGDECRFDFPKMPSNKTIIAVPVDKTNDDDNRRLSEAKAIKKQMKNFIESDEFDEKLTLEEMLEKLKIPKDEYEDALKTSERGSQIVLKRSPKECYINNYNKSFLKSWQANMDLQFCTDVYAVVTYICDYYGKDETGMTEFLKSTLKDAKTLGQKDTLCMLRRTYMSKRQIGLSEAIYRALPSMHLHKSNIGTIFVQSGFPENQSKFLRKVADSDYKEDQVSNSTNSTESDFDCDNETTERENKEGGNVFKIDGREGLYMESTSIHDRYASRPKAVETLTLAQFATSYSRCAKKPKNIIFENRVSVEKGAICDYLTDEALPRYIQLESGVVYSLRRIPKVLRIHASSKKSGEEEDHFAELQLFFSWRNENISTWRKNPQNIKAAYEDEKIQNSILEVRSKIFPFAMNELVEIARTNEVVNNLSDDVKNRLDVEGSQLDADALLEDCDEVDQPATDFDSWVDDTNKVECNKKSNETKYRCLEPCSKDELLSTTRSLVSEQRVVLQKVLDFVKTSVQCTKSRLIRDAPKQMMLIVHGGGGVGKSNATRVCAQWAETILKREYSKQDLPRVLLLCPTGMAASVIDGMTIHSAFDFYFGNEYRPLSDQKLAFFRKQFEELKLIVVDEMSMVSSDVLYKIHHRLTDIFNNNLPFGGISMMFVGDLLQLKPVTGSFIFQRPHNEAYSIAYDSSSLWHNCDTVTLKHNHRQGKNSKWTETLNRLRIGQPTDEDISLLFSRCTTKMSKNYPWEALHLFFTNLEVLKHNDRMLLRLKTQMYHIKAIVDYPGNYKPKLTAYGTIDDTNLSETLNIKIGARSMVVMNIDTNDSLVNGSLGKVVDIITDDDDKVKCIVVRFDSEKAGIKQQKENSHIAKNYTNGTPIFQQKLQYCISSSKSRKQKHAAKATIQQFPLKNAFAVTGHKIQGQTIKKGSPIVVNWHKRMPRGLAYVMLSRAESIEDVFIAGDLNTDKIQCVEAALKETERLEKLSLTNSQDQNDGMKRKLGFSFVNIQSLQKHFEDLKIDDFMLKQDIIFVLETWMDPTSSKNFELDGYDSEFVKRGRGKGIGVFYKTKAKIEVCNRELYQFIKMESQECTIFCLYASKGCPMAEVVKDLKSYGFDNKGDTYLVGDMNFDVSTRNVLTKYLKELNFLQVVERATHFDGHILDQVYTMHKNSNFVDIKQHHVYYSDHDAVIINVKEQSPCDV